MKGRKAILLTEQIQEILWRYDKGCSIESLAKMYQTDSSNIRKILLKHDLVIKKKEGKKIKVDNLYEVDQFDGKICKGKSYSEYLKEKGYKN